MSFPNRPNLYQSSFYFPIEEVIDIGFSRRVLQKCPGQQSDSSLTNLAGVQELDKSQKSTSFLSRYVIFHDRFLLKIANSEFWIFTLKMYDKGVGTMKHLNFRAKIHIEKWIKKFHEFLLKVAT